MILAKYGSHEYLEQRYPAIFRHLSFYKTKLENRGQCRYGGRGNTGQHHWLELDNNPTDAYLAEFLRDKLVWMHMSPRGRFAYSDDGIYCNQKAFIVTGQSLKYLCAILNSSLTTWLVKNTAVTTGMGLLQWDKFTVEAIPIPKVSAEKQQSFIGLVDKILAAKKANPAADTSEREKEIDRLVYALYDLTEKETQVIEGIA